MHTFLLLSLLSGMLELGTVLLAYMDGLPVWAILSMALMYQLGNLLCFPGKHRPDLAVWLSLANLGLYGAGLWLENMPPSSVWSIPTFLCVRAVQVALSSLCIQTMRTGRKSACPTWLKRTFRIAGFVLAPLMVLFPHAGMLLCICLPLAASLSERKTSDKDSAPPQAQAVSPKGLSAVMIFHQMHYFAYTYIMPLVAAELTKSIYAAAALYGLTWVVYLLPQWFAERQKNPDPQLFFFVCHAWLSLTMGMLAAAFSLGRIRLGFAAWMLTGLGGGSVFCIKSLTPRSGLHNMTLSENIGHFLGTAAAVLIALAMRNEPGNPLTAKNGPGAMLAGLSCALVLLTLGAAAEHRSKHPGKQTNGTKTAR